MLRSRVAGHRFRQPKTVENEERCVVNAIPKSTRCKNIFVFLKVICHVSAILSRASKPRSKRRLWL